MAELRTKPVTEREVGRLVSNRLLWEILEELRRPSREADLREVLARICDVADAGSEIEAVAWAALGNEPRNNPGPEKA